MKRKKIPNAIRIHKVKDKNSHEWCYSQLVPYRPFENEDDDLKDARDSTEVCEQLMLHPATRESIEQGIDNITDSHVIKVRKKVMPFIEDVEEAREKVAALNAEIVGEQLDPENEQDNAECNLIEDEVHPDYEIQHPEFFHGDNLPPRAHASSYRKVDLWDNKKIRSEIRLLSCSPVYQRGGKYGGPLVLQQEILSVRHLVNPAASGRYPEGKGKGKPKSNTQKTHN